MQSKIDYQLQQLIIDEFLKKKCNTICADCSNKAAWASIGFGVFLCISCAGIFLLNRK